LRVVKTASRSGQQICSIQAGSLPTLPSAEKVQNTHTATSSQKTTGPPRGRKSASRKDTAPGARMNRKVGATAATEEKPVWKRLFPPLRRETPVNANSRTRAAVRLVGKCLLTGERPSVSR